jgi:cytochrome c-type biogenesis protein CcmF
LTVRGQGRPYQLSSERRFYPSAQTQTTEAGIRPGPLGNLYVSVGEEHPGEGVIVRLWNHPLIVWIWLGGFTMAAGGLVSLSDRRLRLGAAVRAPKLQPVAAE